MISLHSHSGQFCRHAKGNLEDVVKEAIRQGFKVYGLSEHIPRHRREELYPEEEDLELEDLANTFDAYMVEATRLRNKYSSQLELLVGLETEYITSESLDKLELLLERHRESISYIIGSVHHVNGIPIDFDKPTFEKAVASFPPHTEVGLSQLEQLFCSYFDAQFGLMQRVQPEVIGHFDLCRLYLPKASFTNPQVWQKIERNVNFALGYGALFEINAAAFRKGWQTAYPAMDVLELIMAHGGRLTLSDDSHGPHAVGLHYSDALRYLVEQNVHDLWSLTAKDTISGGTDDTNDACDASAVPKRGARSRIVPRKLQEDWRNNPFWVSKEEENK